MPKDKKSKEKKEGSSGKEVELVVKRKNSIVDSSGGSSSSSSSDNSGNSSDHSQSGDSDGSVGFDNEKSTMTSDSAEGSSSSGIGARCSVKIRDRTEEMHRLMNENNHSEPVRVVDEQNGVPIREHTHFVPISNGMQDRQDEPSTSASYSVTKEVAQPISSKPAAKSTKNNCKQKQLTKKQRKELERRENGDATPNYPGQKTKKDIVVEKDNELHVHHFDEWSGDDIRDGEMVVRGANAAAQSMLGQSAVAIPYFRQEEELGPPMRFTDLHKNSQMRYLRNINPVGVYTGFPASVKPLQRMGFGIAASGIPDTEPLNLTINGAKPFMKHQYTDYVAAGAKINNWVSEFVSSSDMDRATQDSEYMEIMQQLQTSIEEMISNGEDEFHKKTIIALRDTDLRQVLLRFGEIERNIVRREQKKRTTEDDGRLPRFDSLSRPARITYVVTQTLNWCTRLFIEKFEDNAVETRACSILMYLASTCPGEKACYEDKHRKCTMLHFMLAKTGDKEKHLAHKFTGGNTLLHFAAMTGSPCQIDVLLRNGAPLNELNDLFKSPVALAIRRHSTLIARQLMWHGADIGSSLTLSHIQPRTPRQTMNKELSEYHDQNSRQIPYKAREFISQRLRALNNTFISWVEAILIDAEARFRLGVNSVKSSLHQIRIGRDVKDGMVVVQGRTYVKKVFNMLIERNELAKEPVVLFLIPCQYTRYDTTMPANYPHIVRVPMITDAAAVAEKIAEKEKIRLENGGMRVEYKDDLKNCRPVKLLGDSVSISFGDGLVDRREVLESFFSYEHNGIIYGYNLPESVTKVPGAGFVHITVTLTIPESEVNRFKDVFFMAQAIQVVVREEPAVKFPLLESPTSIKTKDPRAELIAQQVALRKAELIAAEAQRHKEAEMRDARVRGMVADIQSTVALRKSKKAEEAAQALTAEKVASASVSATAKALPVSTKPSKAAASEISKTEDHSPVTDISDSKSPTTEDQESPESSSAAEHIKDDKPVTKRPVRTDTKDFDDVPPVTHRPDKKKTE